MNQNSDLSNVVLAYFAYGSNMSTARLRERVPSAHALGVGLLERHRLQWHKISKDGSGKCNVVADPEASVYGVLFEIHSSDKPALDRAEGKGFGYDEKSIEILWQRRPIEALTYVATRTNSYLLPWSWYKDHVTYGAREHGLPSDYVAALESAAAADDPDRFRHNRETAIYRRR